MSILQTPTEKEDFKKPSKDEIVGMVLNERDKYERSSKQIRDGLEKDYKNFSLYYDEPYTRYTKRKKEFWGLVLEHTIASASKLFIDAKAINILPKEEGDIPKAKIWNYLIPFQLKKNNMFQKMNELPIDLSLFGTAVSAQEWEYEKEIVADDEGKIVKETVKADSPCFKRIPLLNCYIDPTAESIQKAPSFITEAWVEASTLLTLKDRYGWTADVSAIQGVTLITQSSKSGEDATLTYKMRGVTQRELEVPMVKITTRYGKFPLGWKTGKKDDYSEYVEGEVYVLSDYAGDKNADDKGAPIMLGYRVTPYKHGKRPFEEAWFIKRPGSWYGIGVGFMLRDSQTYFNRVMNQRTDNNEISQNKMFKARRGAGLDNKTLIAAPGKVVTVQNMDDLQVLEVGDAKQSSYADENNIVEWAEKLTHIKDPTDNANTATEAQINASSSGEYFAMVRRNINDYLKRVVEQFIALDKQFIDTEMVIRIVGEPADFSEIDTLMNLPVEIRETLGNMRFITVESIKDIASEFDVEVDIDNSVPINKAMLLQSYEKLLAQSIADPNSGLNRAEIYKEWVNAMGHKGSRFFLNTQNQMYMPMPGQMPMQQGPQGSKASAPMPGAVTNTMGMSTRQNPTINQ